MLKMLIYSDSRVYMLKFKFSSDNCKHLQLQTPLEFLGNQNVGS